MGAGASFDIFENATAEDVADLVETIGPAYMPYKEIIIANGLSGAMLAELTGQDMKTFLIDIGISNKAHALILATHFTKLAKTANGTTATTTITPAETHHAPAQAPQPQATLTHAFLTHDWGVDEFDRDNHARVSRVNRLLKDYGVTTWFDEEKMEGNIRSKMADGVQNTEVLVVFITQRYRDKVNGHDSRDNCKFEFEFGVRQLGPQRMIPVVMERRMKDTKQWKGVLGAELGGLLYVDLTDDDEIVFMNRIQELQNRIASILKENNSKSQIKPVQIMGIPAAQQQHQPPPQQQAPPQQAPPQPVVTVQPYQNSLVRKITGHGGYVLCVVQLDNDRIISGSMDKSIRIWNINSGEKLKELTGHTGSVRCFQLIDNNRLVSGSGDKTLRIWDLSSGSSVSKEAHSGEVNGLTALNDGRIVSCSDDKTIKIWKSDLTLDKTLTGHTHWVYCVKPLPNKIHLVSGGVDNDLKVWDISSGRCIKSLSGHSSRIYNIAILDDGRVATSSEDHSIKVWDVASETSITKSGAHSASLFSIAKLPNGDLITGGKDKLLKVWKVGSNGFEEKSSTQQHGDGIYNIAVLNDGRICTASFDNSIGVFK